MDTTKRGAQDGRLQSTRDQNELGPDFYGRYFWLTEDHPDNRDEHDLPLSSDLWGDYFQHPDNRPEPWDWETAYADPGPGAEFTVHVPAPTGAGADIFF